MDSLGNVIDKLVTVDMKMWDNQEVLYEIRKMSFEEYKEKYFNDESGAEKLWSILKKATDLNVQKTGSGPISLANMNLRIGISSLFTNSGVRGSIKNFMMFNQYLR